MKTLLRAENISRVLAGEVPITLVHNASLEINAGEFVVITGPSGSGKSSLLYLLGLLDMPSSGHIYLQDTDTTTLHDDQRADLRLAKLGFVFQFHFLLPEFSALENVMLPMLRLKQLSDTAARERASALLESVGLDKHLHKLPRQLSGGQSQRVAIARALANNPLLILADEPTGNLDTASSANVQNLLRSIAHDHGRSVITVTHDPSFAAAADRQIVIVDGHIQSDR